MTAAHISPEGPRILADLEESADADTIAATVIALTTDPEDDWSEGVISQCEREGEFTLVLIDVASALRYLPPVDAEKVRAYTAMSSPPPAVFVTEQGAPGWDLVLFDGAHRLAAAHARRQPSVEAWVPADWALAALRAQAGAS